MINRPGCLPKFVKSRQEGDVEVAMDASKHFLVSGLVHPPQVRVTVQNRDATLLSVLPPYYW